MLLDVQVCGVVLLKLPHGQKILKEKDQIGLDLFSKIMLNTDLDNGKQEKLEELNYIMIVKMLLILKNFQKNLKIIYNNG